MCYLSFYSLLIVSTNPKIDQLLTYDDLGMEMFAKTSNNDSDLRKQLFALKNVTGNVRKLERVL